MPRPSLKIALTCALLVYGLAAPANERVRGHGRALVLAGDVGAAEREALSQALRDATLQQGAVVNASSVLDATGSLAETTVVHSSKQMLSYELISASVQDGTAEATIEALFDSGTAGCAKHQLGGTVEVSVSISGQGTPMDAAGIRGSANYEPVLRQSVFDALDRAAAGTPYTFRKPVANAYQQLTLPTREIRVPRGTLQVVLSLQAQAAKARNKVSRQVLLSLRASFEDAFSRQIHELTALQETLVIDPSGKIQPSRLPGLMADNVQAALCATPELPLQREADAFSVAAGSLHGLSTGALFEGKSPAGEQIFFTATAIEPGRSLLRPLGKLPGPLAIAKVTLMSKGT